jgi:tetratricopeptide (TPR) repeat protein
MEFDWQIGERIQNRLELCKILRGGMGIIYVVFDHETHESHAIKTFQDEIFARDPNTAARFTHEARIWIDIDAHPNVVQALWIENYHGQPLLVLEYVSGGDLSDWIGSPRLTQDLPQVLRFAIQFCDGMNHALSKGIQAHRDIKPQNCLLTQDNNLKVTDFGLAKVFDDTPPNAAYAESSVARLGVYPTQTGRAAGTCTHMAPEQFTDAKHVDVRADIYSFGVMLFQMVKGRLPFEARSWQDYARLHGQAAPPPLGSGQLALDMIVRKCLAKAAGERYEGFGILRDELALIYESMTKQPAPKPALGRELDVLELTSKGGALENIGRHEEALVCYDRALALNPKHAAAWCDKARPLASLGRLKEALDCAERALAINPGLVGAMVSKGAVLNMLGRTKEALACLDKCLGVNPQSSEAWNEKGVALRIQGRTEEALDCYERALAIRPQFDEAWNNKGVALEKVGRCQEAVACYDEALAVNSQWAQGWYNKGVALGKLGCYEEAVACYDRALARAEPAFLMTFFPMRKDRKERKVFRTALILLLLCAPAVAQVKFSGQLTVNSVNSTVDLANPVYYDSTVTSYDVSTPGALTRTGYPTIGVCLGPDLNPKLDTFLQIDFIGLVAILVNQFVDPELADDLFRCRLAAL